MKLRTQLGESLASVQRFDVPLEEATTSSLDALTAYSLGRRAISIEGERAAIPYFKRALELDPNFALAYTGLGTAYANLRESDFAKENYQKAYDLRSRVSAREHLRSPPITITTSPANWTKLTRPMSSMPGPIPGIGCHTIISVEIMRLSDNGTKLLPKFVKQPA